MIGSRSQDRGLDPGQDRGQDPGQDLERHLSLMYDVKPLDTNQWDTSADLGVRVRIRVWGQGSSGLQSGAFFFPGVKGTG